MELLFIWLLFAVFAGALAAKKGRSPIVWGFLGLLFGPFGLVVVFFPETDEKWAEREMRRREALRRIGR